jgi:hypothetical protein
VDEDEIRVWVHTCEGGRKRIGPTLESLDASDLKGRYEVLDSPMGDGRTIHKWWSETMTRLATEPYKNGKPPCFIIRLEDDVIVNKHIMHNAASWQAIQEPNFGMGQLFNWDGDYPPRVHVSRRNHWGSLARLDKEFYGAQGQMFRGEIVPRVAAMFPGLVEARWGNQFNLDGAVVRTVCSIAEGSYVGYLHVPSLVNCHEMSCTAASGYKHNGHFSSKTFSPDWRREP